ncbi:MAG: hypothetical protein D6719_06915 [Candidatus Dadabacteria bacterium]|nr:MAG: hypothetical protein D6719_06915 [Candidatus Dadabacteria bacterium]
MTTKIESLKQAGFNIKELKFARRKRLKRQARIWIPLAVIFIALAAMFIDYLARIPRERHAKDASYFTRVKLGAEKTFRAIYLTLMAYPEDPKHTRLPIVELYIKGKRLDKLTEHLPESGDIYQKALFRIKNKDFKVRARLRGDSMNHWAFPQKSWRILLRKGKYYRGQQYFNLVVPRVDNQMSNWLGYAMARELGGLLVPDAEIVHFRLNRRFDGIRLMLEQPNQDFLRRRNLPYGKIFVGDIDSNQIYGGVKRRHLYQDVNAWQVRAPTEYQLDRTEIQELIRVLRYEKNPYRLYYRLGRILDIDSFLRYAALLEIVGSVHVDDTHNGKLYFNPVSGRFTPIVWDTVAYFWKDTKGFDIAANQLFKTLLGIPELREKKDKIIWQALNGPLASENIRRMIIAKANDMRSDVYAFALKLHANDRGIRHISNPEWEEAVKSLAAVVEKRNNRILDRLRKTKASYRFFKSGNKYYFAVKVSSPAGIILNHLSFKAKGLKQGTTIKLKRRGLGDILVKTDPERRFIKAEVADGRVRFKINDHLFSKRRYKRDYDPEVVPAVYVYEIEELPDDAKPGRVIVKGVNAVTGGSFKLKADPKLSISAVHKKNSVWWQPERFAGREQKILEGGVDLKKDLIINEYTDLVIKAGTTVRLAPHVSIFKRGGSLRIQGTAERPVVIKALKPRKNWGTFAVQDLKDGSVSHLILDGGSDDRIGLMRFDGGLVINGSNLKISDSQIRNTRVVVNDSVLSLNNVVLKSIFDNPLGVRNSDIRKERVRNITLPRIHSSKLLEAKAYGTAARKEREFKWSIRVPQNSGLSLKEIARTINSALLKSLDNSANWQAPVHTGNKYYLDKKAKEFVFRDIYFDTADQLSYRGDVSYRLRNRYKDYSSYKRHIKNPDLPQYWPYRLEYQAKVNRKDLGNGFSEVEESRFEFRKESKPFSDRYLPPLPPWDLDEFLPYFEAGNFRGLNILPARSVVQYLVPAFTESAELKFRPSLVLVTERFRQHFNIKSEWGSGPNPEQAYIISLDHSRVYPAESYLSYLRARKTGVKGVKLAPPVGSLVEIEVEFERNVSDVLDQRIIAAKNTGETEEFNRLVSARKAFLADQRKIMEVIRDYAAVEGLKVVPADKSKYRQAYELLYGNRQEVNKINQ